MNGGWEHLARSIDKPEPSRSISAVVICYCGTRSQVSVELPGNAGLMLLCRCCDQVIARAISDGVIAGIGCRYEGTGARILK